MFEEYTNKPKIIEAVRFTNDNKDLVFNAMTGQYAADVEDGEPVLKVTTIHGDVAVVRLGDWIVKESELGYYYPVKDAAFHFSYEAKTSEQAEGFSIRPRHVGV